MTTLPENPSDQLQVTLRMSRLICDIVEDELSIRWGPKPVIEMTDEEVLLQAVNICNVFMQEEYGEQQRVELDVCEQISL